MNVFIFHLAVPFFSWLEIDNSGIIYLGTRRIMLVHVLFLSLLQQSKELQWFKMKMFVL